MISQAYSKLILTGEHAALYGAPALTTQLAWQTRCQWQPHPSHICVQLPDGRSRAVLPDDLDRHHQQLQQRQSSWLSGQHINICENLFDLPLAVLAWWQANHSLPSIKCILDSDIPLGQGLGSSASCIIAMLRGLSRLTQTPLTLDELLQAATELEQLAHGRSSGLDVAAILLGPRLYWQNRTSKTIPTFPVAGYLINTGKAQSSTADCVGYVKQHHGDNSAHWQQHQQDSQQVIDALQYPQDHTLLKQAIQAVQQDLTDLGVVPHTVQSFVKDCHQRGWAGKVCGAGSITGQGAGFFWLVTDNETPEQLCKQYNYAYWPLSGLVVT